MDSESPSDGVGDDGEDDGDRDGDEDGGVWLGPGEVGFGDRLVGGV